MTVVPPGWLEKNYGWLWEHPAFKRPCPLLEILPAETVEFVPDDRALTVEPMGWGIDAATDYELWIGMLYTCAVYRGVVEHPQPSLVSHPLGYVVRVGD